MLGGISGIAGVIDVDQRPFASGSFGELYKGQWTQLSQQPALATVKRIRSKPRQEEGEAAVEARRMLKQLAQPLIQLHHPNVAPLYELVFVGTGSWPSLIMPYYRNGSLDEFLQTHPTADKLNLLWRASLGLDYLHSQRVIHGDIRASNVIVTDDLDAVLADFGIANILRTAGFTGIMPAQACRWMAPELIEDPQGPVPTASSDVWAFAMTFLQVHTGNVPYSHLRADASVIVAVHRGDLPSQPTEIGGPMWELLQRCWTVHPSQRSTISAISIVLGIMISHNLDLDHVITLMNYLEAERMSREPYQSQSASAVPEPQPYYCRWPNCRACFANSPALQGHYASHWSSWEASKDPETAPAKSLFSKLSFFATSFVLAAGAILFAMKSIPFKIG